MNTRIIILIHLIFLSFACHDNPEKGALIRCRKNIDFDWEFVLFADSIQEKNSPVMVWKQVDLPHDWSIEGPFNMDNPSGMPGAYLPGGIGWYRKKIEVPEAFQHQNVIVEFDGVYKDADVWMNDHLLGHQSNGYVSFLYDLTPYLNKNGENVLKVRVDNSDLPHDRWYSGCGIYRHVWLNFVSDIHIPLWGTYITTPEITNDLASVNVETNIRNKSRSDRKCILKTVIISPEKKEIVRVESDVIVPGDSVINISQKMDVLGPVCWSLERPVLYKARSEVYVDNQLCDEYESNFGIREIKFLAGQGFLLNGQKVLMKGVNMHYDAGCLGAAVPDMAIYRRLKILKGMGCNAIRLAHNPHTPELLAMCDTMGILLIDEAFDKWETACYGKAKFPSFDFKNNWEKDLKAFISRDRNHPSIVLWSVGNEVAEVNKPSGVETLKKLVGFVHRYEPTRPVTCALQPGRQENGEPLEMAFCMDVVSYNYMSQYYESDHRKYPGMIFLGSETLPYYTRNNLESNLWEKDVSKKYITGNSFFQVGDFVAGHFIWSGFDYLGEAVQPWPLKGWENGLINTCGFRKPYSFYIQSLYSDCPLVHIAVSDELNKHQIGKKGWDWPPVKSSWDWPFDEDKKLTVYTYTSCGSVELILNGKSIGEKYLKDFPQKMIEWEIPYEPGILLAIGKNGGKEVARHQLVTAGDPVKIDLIPDYSQVRADGKDIIHVTVEVVDRNGNLCTTSHVPVEFYVSGKGRIIGVDNGDLWSNEPYKSNRREVRDGKALCVIQAGKEKGDLVLRACSQGLAGDSILVKIN